MKAYIENGWAHHIMNPDGHSQSSEASAEVGCSVSSPTSGWKSIKTAFHSSTDVPNISISNTFIQRKAVDGKATIGFKSMNACERLFRCGHVQALSVTDEEEFWWVKADCRPEMKKDKMYRMVMSLCRGLGRLLLLFVAAQLEGDYVHHVNM